MNYTRIYESIVLRAQAERTERLALKKQGKYFENHHIVPRSLGGKDVLSNMALLTGREHYICHWLLVKMYKSRKFEYTKMVYALWLMNLANPTMGTTRYKNSRCYEWVRQQVTNQIGNNNKIAQSGNKNSQYGKHWYTNYETGESRSFAYQPNEKWVRGRNLFRGECSKIKKSGNVSDAIERIKTQKRLNAQMVWDDFHKGCYRGLREYCRIHSLCIPTIARTLKKYIPMYSVISTKTPSLVSSAEFIGKYE